MLAHCHIVTEKNRAIVNIISYACAFTAMTSQNVSCEPISEARYWCWMIRPHSQSCSHSSQRWMSLKLGFCRVLYRPVKLFPTKENIFLWTSVMLKQERIFLNWHWWPVSSSTRAVGWVIALLRDTPITVLCPGANGSPSLVRPDFSHTHIHKDDSLSSEILPTLVASKHCSMERSSDWL